jgi:hypothetical protein
VDSGVAVLPSINNGFADFSKIKQFLRDFWKGFERCYGVGVVCKCLAFVSLVWKVGKWGFAWCKYKKNSRCL